MAGNPRGASGRAAVQNYFEELRDTTERVWDYTIGGYQVIKKWLSYREKELLGRSLTLEEAREVTNIARRIAGIILLQGQLDENYWAVISNCYKWPEGSTGQHV